MIAPGEQMVIHSETPADTVQGIAAAHEILQMPVMSFKLSGMLGRG